MSKLLKISFVLFIVVTLSSLSPLSQLAQAATIKINKKELTLIVGQSDKLNIIGTKSIKSWKSSNKTVATVSKTGNVTANKKGTTTITATVDKKKYTCKVTVENKELTDEDYAALGWILLRSQMKNMNSLVINEIKFGAWSSTSIRSGELVIVYDYSAENSYGGTTRSYAYVFLDDLGGVKPEDVWFASLLGYNDFDKNKYLSVVTVDSLYKLPVFDNLTKVKVKTIQQLFDKYLEDDDFKIY